MLVAVSDSDTMEDVNSLLFVSVTDQLSVTLTVAVLVSSFVALLGDPLSVVVVERGRCVEVTLAVSLGEPVDEEESVWNSRE